MHGPEQGGFGSSENKLATFVGHFVHVMDVPERFGPQIEAIVKEADQPELSEQSRGYMQLLMNRMKATLPEEFESLSDKDLEVNLRAALELRKM